MQTQPLHSFGDAAAQTTQATQGALSGMDSSNLAVIGAALLVVVFFGILVFFVKRFRRCPSNKILIISGKVRGGNSARVISGGGAFVWPVIQEYAYMDLTPMQVDIPLKDALSAENIRVAVPSVFTVGVGQDLETQQNAAAAQQASSAGESLMSQTTELEVMVASLRDLVNGQGGTSTHAAPAPRTRAEHKPSPAKTEKRADSKVIAMPSRHRAPKKAEKMAVGQTSTPSEHDPRFEDV